MVWEDEVNFQGCSYIIESTESNWACYSSGRNACTVSRIEEMNNKRTLHSQRFREKYRALSDREHVMNRDDVILTGVNRNAVLLLLTLVHNRLSK